jgi:DNA-binding CsgD family transcriptional regulator
MDGHWRAAAEQARRGYTDALDRPDLGARAMWAFALGQLLLWWGDPAAAAPLLTEAATTMADRPTGLGPGAHMHCLGNLAEARALLGDVDGARRALADVDLVPVGDCTSTALDTGRAWTLAAGGHLDRARDQLRRTAAAADGLGNRLAAVRALLDLARLGDRAAARTLTGTGAELQGPLSTAWPAYAASVLRPVAGVVEDLERLGLRLLAGEAALTAAAGTGAAHGAAAGLRLAARGRRLLDELAVPAPWTGSPAPPVLTRRETEVARLAAGGRSSRAVAAALHLSVRTVDSHLAHAYRKLGVHTRHQLAAALRDIDTLARPGRTPTAGR